MTLPSALRKVDAQPFEFTFDYTHTALIVIDMQRDFIEAGGFGESLGNDVSTLAAIVPVVAGLLAFARQEHMLVVHTREAHLPDLSDCPLSKISRGNPSLRIGDAGPMGRVLVRGQPGSEIVSALQPAPGEIVIDKPGKGAFHGTDLHALLQQRGISHLLFAGVTTEVCVQTTMREANDRGYDCLLVEDATASYFPAFKQATLEMVRAQGGIVGWTAPLSAIIDPANHIGTAPMLINHPPVIAELNAEFDAYEAALIRHDVAALDRFFRYDDATVRYGVAENLYGGEAIRQYRMRCAPVHPQRKIVLRVTSSYGNDFGAISAEFNAPDTDQIGRQTQTWVRFPDGWRIVAAHVSLID